MNLDLFCHRGCCRYLDRVPALNHVARMTNNCEKLISSGFPLQSEEWKEHNDRVPDDKANRCLTKDNRTIEKNE